MTVNDANGCSTLDSAQLISSDGPNASATATDASCGNTNGAIDLNVTGGSAPYTFQWSNGASVEDATELAAGLYNVTVSDASGCSAIVPDMVVGNSNDPSVDAAIASAGCSNNDGSIDVTVSGGVLPYQFAWSNGATIEDLLDAAASTYSITVTDANGCSQAASYVVDIACGFSITAVAVDETCGDANGSVDASIIGGVAPFDFLWSNGDSVEDPTNLVAGSYAVTVTDANGSTAVTSVDVNGISSPTIALVVTDATCGNTNGNIEASVSSGTSPYNFLWSNASTDQNITGLDSGTYAVTVTDANGCTVVQTATIGAGGGPTIVLLSATDPTCGNSDGEVSINVSGGSSPYTITWSNGATAESLNGLTAGSYTLTVTDATGCADTFSHTIINQNGPTVTNMSVVDVGCSSNDGSVTLTVTGGTTPYSFLWSNGITTQDLLQLGAGTYDVTITDANGCEAIANASVDAANTPTVVATSENAACGNADGSVDLSITGGTSPYSFVWSNGATTQNVYAVPAGDYTVTVTDNNGCTAIQTANVSNTNGPVLTVTSVDDVNGSTIGSIDLSVSDGTPPYSFAWSNGASTEDIDSLTSGTYNVTVNDAAGCTAIGSAFVDNVFSLPPELTLNTTDAACGLDNGLVDASASGAPPFTFVWSNGATVEDLTGLSAGTYSVTVTDNNGTSISGTAIVDNTTGPSLVPSQSNPTCNMADGFIDLTVSGGTAPFVYSWSNGLTSEDIDGLSAGVYDVTVTDANMCTVTISSTLVSTNGPQLTSISVPSGCASPNGSIDVTVSSGLAPFTYAWSNGVSTEDLTNVATGIYTVTVNDANGCSVTHEANVGSTQLPVVVTSATNSACGQQNGSVVATASNGEAPYVFLWSDGSTSNELTNVASGDYTVTVTDAAGCTTVGNATVNDLSGPLVTLVVSSEACNQTNGSIAATVSSGTPPYAFAWSNGGDSQSLSGLSSGDYSVTVTDANNCSVVSNAFVDSIAGPTLQLVTGDATCGFANGFIDVTISSGTAPYAYEWSNALEQEDIGELAVGTYNVTVTDATGCTAVGSATIENIPAGTLELNGLVDTLCAGASFVASASGMNSYQWTPSAGLSSTNAATVTVSVFTNQTYTVVGVDSNGCIDSASFVVSAMPSAQAIPVEPYAGCAPQSITLNSELVNAIGVEWWIDGQTYSGNGSAVTVGEGNYDVTLVALSPYGCNDTTVLQSYVQAFGPPRSNFEISESPSEHSDPPSTFTFNNLSSGGFSYAWDFGDGSFDTAVAPVHAYANPGSYAIQLIVVNAQGCADTSVRTLDVDASLTVFVPNTFTPNGDGQNDVLTVYGKHVKSFRMRLYDRWGTNVFDSDSGVSSWDGIFQGEKLNTGVFVYVVDVVFLDETTKALHGDVTLLR